MNPRKRKEPTDPIIPFAKRPNGSIDPPKPQLQPQTLRSRWYIVCVDLGGVIMASLTAATDYMYLPKNISRLLRDDEEPDTVNDSTAVEGDDGSSSTVREITPLPQIVKPWPEAHEPEPASSAIPEPPRPRPNPSHGRRTAVRLKSSKSSDRTLAADVEHIVLQNEKKEPPSSKPPSPSSNTVNEELQRQADSLINEVFFRGVRRHYANRPHIFEKQHKEQVRVRLQEQLNKKMDVLFDEKRKKGFQGTIDDLKGWFNYYMKIETATRDLGKYVSHSDPDAHTMGLGLVPERARRHSNPLPHHASLACIQRAIHMVKETLAEPMPPSTPSFDKIFLSHRQKDKAIDRRLHGPKPLPSSLSRDEESWVAAFLSNRESASKFSKERVSHKDIIRLSPEQWLNDEIINFYGAMIMGRAESTKENNRNPYLRVHYFSTFFWTKLTKEGYERGRLGKWSKKVDIFEKDVVLIPVNHGNAHWTSAAINFRCKRIESYDSMGFRHEEVYRALRDYLDAEHRNKRGRPFDFTGWQDHYLTSTPQQENGYDCGVFTCQILESLSRGVEEFNFSQRDMPYLRRRMIWEIGHSCLREET